MLLRWPDKLMTLRLMSILQLLQKSLLERHKINTLLRRLTSSVSKCQRFRTRSRSLQIKTAMFYLETNPSRGLRQTPLPRSSLPLKTNQRPFKRPLMTWWREAESKKMGMQPSPQLLNQSILRNSRTKSNPWAINQSIFPTKSRTLKNSKNRLKISQLNQKIKFSPPQTWLIAKFKTCQRN